MVSWRGRLPAAVIAAFGGGLLLASGIHHATEVRGLDHPGGPVSAFAVDVVPAILLVVAGYFLATTDFDERTAWRVTAWTTVGGVLFAGVTTGTILVRRMEGRTIAEPEFPLLVLTGMGAVAGFVAGYFEARARQDAVRAERTSHAFSFVNDVLRHDIRNKLGIIRGYAEIIADDSADESTHEQATTVREQADDALDRIQNAGTIAKTLTGDADLEPVDVTDAVVEAAEHVDDAFEATVTTDVPEAAHVRANDAVQLVVDNLVENAAEHNDADDPRVAVAVERVDDDVRIEVRDNGPGVGDVLDQVEEGGLALVQTLVGHYDGDIEATTSDPTGSVFTVTLPRASPAEPSVG